MAMATCWNCGARLAGATCQMCGAAQRPDAMPGSSPAAPGGQPVVSQASMSVRPPQVAAGNQYVPGGQYAYPPAAQSGGWQGYQQPAPGQGGWQGYPQPSAYQQQQAALGMPPSAAASRQPAGLDPTGLVLGLAGGTAGAVIGALAWAFFLQLTKTNFWLLGVVLGFAVGFGVLLGARGQRHIVLALLAGVLGLVCFFLALYFRLSLAYADFNGEGTNLFALPFADFFDTLKLYLQDNPINYINFVLVPLIAAGTAFNNRVQRRGVRRR